MRCLPVLHSASTALLVRVWEAVMLLLHPLEWPLVYVPLLPDPLADYLQAPTIFAYGVPSDVLAAQLADEPQLLDGVVIIDLDLDR